MTVDDIKALRSFSLMHFGIKLSNKELIDILKFNRGEQHYGVLLLTQEYHCWFYRKNDGPFVFCTKERYDAYKEQAEKEEAYKKSFVPYSKPQKHIFKEEWLNKKGKPIRKFGSAKVL